MFPDHQTLGATLPAGTAAQSWAMEFVLTLMLMVVVLSVATGAKEKGLLAGVAVGAVIALEALFGGPVSGASMNPARSLAPAVVSGRLNHLWVYLTAPVAGALAGMAVCRVIHPPGQCCHPTPETGVMHDVLERSHR
jgi:aquaporin Z